MHFPTTEPDLQGTGGDEEEGEEYRRKDIDERGDELAVVAVAAIGAVEAPTVGHVTHAIVFEPLAQANALHA